MIATIYGRSGYSYQVIAGLVDVEFTIIDNHYEVSTLDLTGVDNMGVFKEVEAQPIAVEVKHGKKVPSIFIIRQFSNNNGMITIKGESLKSLLKNDVLMDFTNISSNITYNVLFNLIEQGINAILSPQNIHLTIEKNESTWNISAREVSDVYGKYVIVNALAFLKPYLVMKNGFINDSEGRISVGENGVSFKTKVDLISTINTELKLEHFEAMLADNQAEVTQVTATVEFQTEVNDQVWQVMLPEEYLAEPAEKRREQYAEMESGVPYNPPIEDFDQNAVYKFVSGFQKTLLGAPYAGAKTSGNWMHPRISDTTNVVWDETKKSFIINKAPEASEWASTWGKLSNRELFEKFKITDQLKLYHWYQGTIPIGKFPPYMQGEALLTHEFTAVGFPDYATVWKIEFTDVRYMRIVNRTFIPRPNMPEAKYYLGNDNKIYQGTIPANKMIFPPKNRVFESDTLYKAQLNALSELASARYPFNYIIKQTTEDPIDLSEFKMGDKINEVPISQIKYNSKIDAVEIRLGFKKRFLTEILAENKKVF